MNGEVKICENSFFFYFIYFFFFEGGGGGVGSGVESGGRLGVRVDVNR